MIEGFIRDVNDFPKAGIVFKDITPLLADRAAMQEAISGITDHYQSQAVDVIVGPESRGFIFGIGVSMTMGRGFVPIRKPGKLPCATYSQSYQLEYGTDTLGIHKDAIKPGQKVLLVDDLLATGGTMQAAAKLVEQCGGEIVGCAFIIELEFLNGRKTLSPHPVHSLIKYGE